MSNFSRWLKRQSGDKIPEINLTRYLLASVPFGGEVARLKEIAAREIAEELDKFDSREEVDALINSNAIRDALYARIQKSVAIPPFLEGPLSALVAGYDLEKLEDKATGKIDFAKIDKLGEDLVKLVRGLKVI